MLKLYEKLNLICLYCQIYNNNYLLLRVAPQVRGAFFEMVCALCEFTPGLVQAEAARLCPAVLLSIDDTDPAVLPPVWEAVLHVVSTIPVSFCLKDDFTHTGMLRPLCCQMFSNAFYPLCYDSILKKCKEQLY